MPNPCDTGQVRLEIGQFQDLYIDGVKVWAGPGRSNQLLPDNFPFPFWWPPHPDGYPSLGLPPTVLVEATETGNLALDMIYNINYFTETVSVDRLVLQSVAPEIDLDLGGIVDEDEESPGGFVALNDNDTDENLAPDLEQSELEGETTEIDFLWLMFELTPSNITTGFVKLEAISGASNIKLWDDFHKGPEHLITLPKTWDLSTESLPTEHWGIEGIATSSGPTDVVLKLSYINDSNTICSDTVRLSVIDVDWQENAGQTYGYDGYSYPFFPYKSVKVSGSDIINACITPGSLSGNVYFRSRDTGIISVSPSQASGSPQLVMLTGNTEDSICLRSQFRDAGFWWGVPAADFGGAAYIEDSYTLAVRIVHEEDDDVQVIPYGNSTGSETDICISPGVNGKRDTIPCIDDIVSGENILVGLNKICDTIADDTTDTTTPGLAGSGVDLSEWLNTEVYNQAVVTWGAVVLTEMTVNWDLDVDGKFDTSANPWTPEQQAVIDNCRDDAYDFNVFFVNDTDLPTAWGIADYGQPFVFVFSDRAVFQGQVIAHELGHAAFSLIHKDNWTNNLMKENSHPDYKHLRKAQWDIIQDKQEH